LAACKEKQEEQDRGDDWAEEKRRMVEWQHRYLNDIADLKTVFYNEIKVWIHMYTSISITFIIILL
jgi:hypothetical protein